MASGYSEYLRLSLFLTYFVIFDVCTRVFSYMHQNDLDSAINNERAVEHCARLTEADWISLLRKFVLDNPYVAVVGKPSAALGESMRSEEEARIDEQRKRLGNAELKVNYLLCESLYLLIKHRSFRGNWWLVLCCQYFRFGGF